MENRVLCVNRDGIFNRILYEQEKDSEEREARIRFFIPRLADEQMRSRKTCVGRKFAKEQNRVANHE